MKIIEESIPSSTRLIKYLIKIKDSIFFVYVTVTMDNYAEFYLQLDEYGIIEFEIGFTINDNKSIFSYITENINEWTENYKNDIEKLEN